MYVISWGIYDEDLKRVRKGRHRYRAIEPALVDFINHDTSPKWDWVTIDLDKTK